MLLKSASLALMIFIAAMAPAAMAGTTKFVYDELGRVTEVDYPDGSIVTYQYDPAGNRTQVTRTVGTNTVKVVVVPLLGGLVIPIS